MVELNASERREILKRFCFFRPISEIPGYGRFYSADWRFPCSVAVPGQPNFVYHRWDPQFLGVTFDIRSDEDVAIFYADLNELADGDSLARKVLHGQADVVSYADQFERGSSRAMGGPGYRIRRQGAHVPGFTAHRVMYNNGWQRIFFMDSFGRMWSIHNRGIGEKEFSKVAASFRLLPDRYFDDLHDQV